MSHSDRILQKAYKVAQEKGLKVIYINLYKPFVDKKYNPKYVVSPQEWLGYIENASYVITNSFHGTVFSILFKKSFISCLISNAGRNERLVQLMKLTGLNHCFINEEEFAFEEINYTKVYERLEKEKGKSLKYLSRIVSDI